MHVRWLLALPLAAVVLAAALFLRPGASEQPVELPAAPEPEAEAQASPSEELELEIDGELVFERESLALVEPQIEAGSPPVELHGTLIDLNTNLPLPEFEIEFEVAGGGDGPLRITQARTDEKGRFRCATPILVARCVVRYLDHPGQERPQEATIELEDVRKGELTLAVAWGPTYKLAFEPRERIDVLDVDLRLRGAAARSRNANSSEWEGVRAGDAPWVRFAPIRKDAPKVEKLVARARNGLWAGEAAVSTTRGVAPGVTLITFEERAVLNGSVCDADKKPLADVDIALEAQDASGQTLRRGARTGENGRFRFEQLPACMGQLRVVSVRHAPWSQGVTLLAGQEQELAVVLAPLAIAGEIGVRVESESGRYTPPFTLVLTLENEAVAEGGERFSRRVRGRWSDEGGRQVARFRFPELPKQSFRVQVQKDDFFGWEPQQLTLQPPAEDARILIRDGIPNASLCFRVKDAQTGKALPGFELTLEFPGSKQGPRRMGARSGQAFLEHLPLERKLAWRVEADGHAPEFGDLSAFELVENRANGELRVCELELRPGWGESYRFVDARNRTPLKGVKVLLDGQEAGTSAAGGRVRVRAAAAPARIEYKSDELGIAARPLRAEKRMGCVADVVVAPARSQKGKR